MFFFSCLAFLIILSYLLFSQLVSSFLDRMNGDLEDNDRFGECGFKILASLDGSYWPKYLKFDGMKYYSMFTAVVKYLKLDGMKYYSYYTLIDKQYLSDLHSCHNQQSLARCV